MLAAGCVDNSCQIILGVLHRKLRLKVHIFLVAGLWSLCSTFLADNLALDKRSGIDLTR